LTVTAGRLEDGKKKEKKKITKLISNFHQNKENIFLHPIFNSKNDANI
jgi:hypothetical protein